VDLCRQLEATGISFISVHVRTAKERAEPVRLETIRCIVDALNIPVIANGDVTSLEKAYEVQEATGVRGVMSARAILANPGLYNGHSKTPLSAIKRWIEINEELDSYFTLFHKHLIHMCESVLTKAERRIFNNLRTKEEVITFLNDRFFHTEVLEHCQIRSQNQNRSESESELEQL